MSEAKLENYQFSLDVFGVYFPVPGRPRSLVGFVANAASDTREKDGESAGVMSCLMGLSSMNFFGPEAGAGFFIRADLGMAWYTVSGLDVPAYESDLGYGGLVGGGYGFRAGDGVRILLNVNYALRHSGGENLSTVGMSVGCLF